MAMAGSGMISAIAISIGRIGNFNHTGRKLSEDSELFMK